jgi:hypothetical protein
MGQLRVWFGVALLAVASCGGVTSQGSGGDGAVGGNDGGVNDGGGETRGSTGGMSGGHGGAPCPATAPLSNAPCDPSVSYRCEYANAGGPQCFTSATCDTLTMVWSVAEPGPGCGEPPPPPCPATFSTLSNGAACPDLLAGPGCEYGEGRCECVTCDQGYVNGHPVTDREWRCRRWDDVAAGCPSSQPPVGSACHTPGQACQYLTSPLCVTVGYDVVCRDGYWRIDTAPASMSMCTASQCLH